MSLTTAAFSRFQIEFQRIVRCSDGRDRLLRRIGQQSSTQIGMNDYAGGVDEGTQTGT